MGELLKGDKLRNYLSDISITGIQIKLKFLSLYSPAIFPRLASVDGKKIYNFSINFHTKVIPKFALESGKSYYVWEKDIPEFNRMSSDEQVEYLQTVKYDNTVIGEIDAQTINSMLKPLVKKNVMYNMTVQDSDITDISWLIFETDGVGLALWTKTLIEHANNYSIELDHYFKRKIHSSNITKVDDLIDKVDSNKYLASKKVESRKVTNSGMLQYYYVVYGYYKEDRMFKKVPLFSISIVTIELSYYVQCAITKSLAEIIEPKTITLSKSELSKNYKTIPDFIQSLCNDLEDIDEIRQSRDSLLELI